MKDTAHARQTSVRQDVELSAARGHHPHEALPLLRAILARGWKEVGADHGRRVRHSRGHLGHLLVMNNIDVGNFLVEGTIAVVIGAAVGLLVPRILVRRRRAAN